MAQMISQGLQQKQTLKQVMAPQQLLGIELLQLSALELEQRIKNELVENPLLELPDEGTDDVMSSGEADETSAGTETEPDEKNDEFYPESIGKNDTTEDSDAQQNIFNDYQPTLKPAADSDFDSKAYIEAQSAGTPSLIEHLLMQLYGHEMNERDFAVGSYLISQVNGAGYMTASADDFKESFPDLSPAGFDRILSLVQSFDPPGVAARDLRECLLIQLQQKVYTPTEENEILAKDAQTILRDHYPLFEKLDKTRIARELNISRDWMENIFEFIGKLEPMPGRIFTVHDEMYIYPDVSVENKTKTGEFEIRIKNERISKLQLNQVYLDLMNRADKKSKESKFLKSRYHTARDFIQQVENRNSTLLKVVGIILEKQSDFFIYGPARMKPLNLSTVADELDMHESTISRVTSNKYIQTPWGIFSFRYFFSSGKSINAEGDVQSAVSLKVLIEKVIKSHREDGKHLSDQKIADILKTKGIEIARLTVNKHRRQLNL